MVKIYQYSKFCNFTHKHSNFKCVYSKDIDTLTGDGSAVGHCTVGQPLGCSGSLKPPPRSSPLTCIRLGKVIFTEFCLLIYSQPDKTEKLTAFLSPCALQRRGQGIKISLIIVYSLCPPRVLISQEHFYMMHWLTPKPPKIIAEEEVPKKILASHQHHQ